MDQQQTRRGIIFALIAYITWGLAPTYFKQLQAVPAYEILSSRIIWSFFFMLILLSLGRHWKQVRAVLQNKKRLLLLAVSSLLIGANWLIYIWAINNNHMLEASLGYFITPLVNVLLGMLFLGERFRRLQWLAVALALIGVLIQLWEYGSLPVVGLGLAFTFAFYGLLRKKLAVDAQAGMLFETLWLLPAALVYLLLIADTPTSHFSENPLSLNLLLISAGVITTLPLICFAAAAKALRLSTLGFFQYISPTLIFILAVGLYGEVIGPDKWLTFAFIWSALLLFIADALYHQRQSR